jgi:hypothetical protein
MTRKENRAGFPNYSNGLDRGGQPAEEPEIGRPSPDRTRAVSEVGSAIAQTALRLYIGEIRQSSGRFHETAEAQDNMQHMVAAAFQEKEAPLRHDEADCRYFRRAIISGNRRRAWPRCHQLVVAERQQGRPRPRQRRRSRWSRFFCVADPAGARSSELCQPGMFQQTRRHPNANRPTDVRKSSCPGDAEVRGQKCGGSGSQGARRSLVTI